MSGRSRSAPWRARRALSAECRGQACADIAGATASTFALSAIDIGRTLPVLVTRSNSGGTRFTESGPTAVLVQKPPANGVAPSITGTPRDGETLTASPGTWSGGPAFTYRWRRCSPACVDAGTGPTYLLKASDVGSASA